MRHKTLFPALVLAATAIGGVAFAETQHGHANQPGSSTRPQMMQRGDGGMMEGRGGMMKMMHQMHSRMMGSGMMGGMSGMESGMMRMFDADNDGTVTPEELRTQLQAKLTEFDSDGDGALSIAEFETLHSAMIRETMVDRFQHLDADGDGAVTTQEMSAHADMMERMQAMHATDGMADDGHEMGEGGMKKDN